MSQWGMREAGGGAARASRAARRRHAECVKYLMPAKPAHILSTF